MLHLVLNCVLQKKWTPLHLAARNGHVLVVKSLIKSGADVKIVEKVGSFVCVIINDPYFAHYCRENVLLCTWLHGMDMLK